MTKLDNLMAELEAHVKRANIQKEDVLDGDRADFKGGDKPHEEGKRNKEMDDSSFHKERPVEESFDPSISSSDKVPEVSKAAALADKILAKISEEMGESKKDSEEVSEEEKKEIEETVKEVVKQIKEEGDSKEDTESKTAGARDFFKRVLTEQGEFLHKCAEYFDPDYNGIVDYMVGQQHAMAKTASERDYLQGAYLAESVMRKVGSDLAFEQQNLMKQDTMQKMAADQDYLMGASLAEQTIQKLAAELELKKKAADLVGVKSLLQEMYAKNLLSETEKEALIQALGSQELLTNDTIKAIVMQVTGSPDIASAIISQTDGNTSTNVVPAPSQPISAPALPANTKSDTDEELKVVQAALRILERNKKGN